MYIFLAYFCMFAPYMCWQMPKIHAPFGPNGEQQIMDSSPFCVNENKKLYNITCKTCHGELGQRNGSNGWTNEIVPINQLTWEISSISKAILNHMPPHHIRAKFCLQNARVKRIFYLFLKCQFETQKINFHYFCH
jgi:hypothetical protein